MGRRLVLLIVAVGLGSSVLATAAAPQAPERRATPLTEGTISQFTEKDAERAARRVLRRLESLYGHKLKVPLAFLHDQPLPANQLAETNPARRDTQGDWQAVEDGLMKGCLIEPSPKFRILKPKAFVGNLAHEITHCFQLQAAGGAQKGFDLLSTSPWLAEGSAEWVAYQYVGNGWGKTEAWNPYITQPEKGLFTRDL